jgi:hypothetical protein
MDNIVGMNQVPNLSNKKSVYNERGFLDISPKKEFENEE